MQDTISPSLNPQRGSSGKKLPMIIFIVIVAAVVGGILLIRQPKKTQESKTEVIATKEPTPTEKPKIDKKTVKIQVLNGTGTPGQAGSAVDALKKAGYSQDNIKTGNAPDFNHLTTTITAKAGFEEIANDVRDSLKSTFSNAEVESSPLDKNNAFDIVVVTGGKKYEVSPTATTAPAQSPTPSPTATTTTTPTPTPTPTSAPTLTP